MKLLCVIDSLGSGGAQRQMVNLACGLKQRGHGVELFVYHPNETFFRKKVEVAGIPVHAMRKGKGFSPRVVWRLARQISTSNYDGVISFLGAPNVYSEIAKIVTLSSTKLVVSERSSVNGERRTLANIGKRWLHLVANRVVANSHDHTHWLRQHPWLRNKTSTIYNGYELIPLANLRYSTEIANPLSLLVIGRICPSKNGLRLLQAFIQFCSKHGDCPVLYWAGRQEQDRESLKLRREMEDLLRQNPNVSNRWHFLGERSDVYELLMQTDALVHVSLYEGLPNSICEAFVAGRPVIASDVNDHHLLVEDGKRGILCDPYSSESICQAIEDFSSLSNDTRHRMGQRARDYAERELSVSRMVAEYEVLLGAR